jgi:hypothetical protein
LVLPFLILKELGGNGISFLSELDLGLGISAQVVNPSWELREAVVAPDYDHIVATPEMSQCYRPMKSATATNGGYQ